MNIELKPMDARQKEQYIIHSMRVYAQSMIDQGEYSDFASAFKAAETEVRGYYSGTYPEDRHYVYNIIETSSKKHAGYLAFSFLKQRHAYIAFVDYIETFQGFQRKGYAKDAMIWMEDFVKQHKIFIIDLNVMMHKGGAQKLYQSLGYQITQARRFGHALFMTRYDMRKFLN